LVKNLNSATELDPDIAERGLMACRKIPR